MSREQAIKNFQNDRFGMFIHWGLYSITARDMWYYSHEKVPQEKYEKLFHRFNPVDYDPTQWAELAKDAGMRYAVITTKHHDGFCLFDSQLTDFKVTNTPYGKDLLTPWVKAFRKAGLKVGFYYSLLDWHHPHYPIASTHPQRHNEQVKMTERDCSHYLSYLNGQVRELLTNYGKIDILWFDCFDGKWRKVEDGAKLKDMIYQLMPDIIVNNRFGMSDSEDFKDGFFGDFDTPEQSVPTQSATKDSKNRPWETCMTIGGHSWGYWRQDPDNKSIGQLIRTLVDVVSKGGNLLLNVGPTPRGQIQEEFVERLTAMGKWLVENGESIYGAGASQFTSPPDARYTQKGDTLYLHLFNCGPGNVFLPGLAGKVQYATVLRDGTDVRIENYKEENLEVFMPAHMVDPHDSVIALKLNSINR